MVTKPRLTAVERARRKKIGNLIENTKFTAKHYDGYFSADIARLLDDLVSVAKEYLKILRHGKPKIDRVFYRGAKALIKEAHGEADKYGRDAQGRAFELEIARLLDDLADVAERYLEGLKNGKH